MKFKCDTIQHLHVSGKEEISDELKLYENTFIAVAAVQDMILNFLSKFVQRFLHGMRKCLVLVSSFHMLEKEEKSRNAKIMTTIANPSAANNCKPKCSKQWRTQVQQTIANPSAANEHVCHIIL